MEQEEEEVWRSPAWLYPSILTLTGILIVYRSRSTAKDKHGRVSVPFVATFLPSAFLYFQRRFFSIFYLAVAAESLQMLYGESFLQKKGWKREEIAIYFIISHVVSLFLGTFLGILTDFIGKKKACVIYFSMQIITSVAKTSSNPVALRITSISQGLASALLVSTFETWMVVEHEKLGFHQEWMSDTFWRMSFGMAVVAVGSAALGNYSLTWKLGMSAPSVVAAGVSSLASIGMMFLWEESSASLQTSFWGFCKNVLQTLADKRLIVLGWSHACFDFASAVFWFLWIPTLVADGRVLQSGMIYACLSASEMLGSVIAAMVLSGPWNVRPEYALLWVFVSAALSLFISAYDYQEIGVLVSAFCAFHICCGISWPLLARLRSIYIPSDHRAAMINLFRVPMHAAVVFILVNGGIHRHLENSSVFGLSILGLLLGVYCLHRLNQGRQVPHDKSLVDRP